MDCGLLQIINDYELYYDIITRTERLEKFGKRWTLTHLTSLTSQLPKLFSVFIHFITYTIDYIANIMTEHTNYYNICALCHGSPGGVFFKFEDAGWWGCGVGVWLCDMCRMLYLCVGGVVNDVWSVIPSRHAILLKALGLPTLWKMCLECHLEKSMASQFKLAFYHWF